MFCQSCKKNIDNTPPEVSISSPYENQQFAALDTVWVTASVEDETVLKQIDITLTDNNQIPVLATVSLFPTNKSTTIHVPYELNDINLASGTYYIWVKASDGRNTNDAWRAIYINAVPQTLNYVYILSNAGSSSMHVLRKTPTGNPQQMFDISGDFSSSAASSRFQLFHICGIMFGNLNAYSVPVDNATWSVPVISSPPTPYFENIACYNDILYTSYYTGIIKGFKSNGSQVFTATTPTGSYPVKLAANSTYLFADHAMYAGSSRIFAVYYLVNGMMKQQMPTDYTVVNIFEYDNDDVLIFGNQSGQGIIKLYNISNNITTALQSLPSGKIKQRGSD